MTLQEALQQKDEEQEQIPREPDLGPNTEDDPEYGKGSDAHANETVSLDEEPGSGGIPSLASEMGGGPSPTAAGQAPIAAAPDDEEGKASPSLAAELGNAGTPSTPVKPSLSDTLGDQINAALAKKAALNAPLSTKGKLALALETAAPTALGAIFGGKFGAAGAAGGTAEAQGIRTAQKNVQAGQLQQEIDSARQAQAGIEERGIQADATKEAARERLQGVTATVAGRSQDVGTKVAGSEAVANTRASSAEDVANIRAKAAQAVGGVNPDGTLNAKGSSAAALKDAQTQHEKAMTDLASNPDNPVFQKNYALKKEALDNAQKALEANLGFRRESLNLQEEKVNNPQPTAQERGRADLAKSASEQIDDMRSIIQEHPEVFGPVAGRTTDITEWIGSQSADAQRFATAKAIAADHMTGAFGARGGAIITQMENALGSFKNNPAAGLAALDQVQKAARNLEAAGTVRPAGAAKPSLAAEGVAIPINPATKKPFAVGDTVNGKKITEFNEKGPKYGPR